MQAQGSLTETELSSLLQAAQTERATGTLTVRDGGGRSVSLYFLFGHLFHAAGEGSTGDDAVVHALTFPTGEFEFDAKAKLPADETVKSGLPDLLRAAESAARHAPAHGGDAGRQREPEPREEARAPEPREAAPQPRRGVKHRPTPKHGREPIPVPAGQVIYDSLKTSFVDFPRLITTLEKEEYTGYVRLLTDDAAGLILFRDGAALECVYDEGDDPEVILGKPALTRFNDDVTHGQGVLDVVGLSVELVEGLYELTVARPKYSELFASWVDMPALLKFLHERKLNGSVMVRAKAGTGVIILTDGKVSGAYTSDDRDISDKVDGVLDLCKDEAAMIEVKAADNVKHPPLDVDEVMGVRGHSSRAAAPEREAPPPPPPVEPPRMEAREEPARITQPLPTQPAPPPKEPDTQPIRAVQVEEKKPEPPPPPRPAGPQLDWQGIIQELQALAEESLGNRSRKVKDILAGADTSVEGIEAAIDQVPTISLLFVDSSRLEQLAQEMRVKFKSHL